MRMLPTNGTTEEMMKPPEIKPWEELERDGEKTVSDMKDGKNILAPLT